MRAASRLYIAGPWESCDRDEGDEEDEEDEEGHAWERGKRARQGPRAAGFTYILCNRCYTEDKVRQTPQSPSQKRRRRRFASRNVSRAFLLIIRTIGVPTSVLKHEVTPGWPYRRHEPGKPGYLT